MFELHVNLFGVEPPSQTCTGRSPLASRRRRSECRGRDAKCVGNAPFSSRSGRIASGITWRRRRGAVLGSPHARAPKVSPKMVGSLLRGNDFGGNPQEGGNNTSLLENVTPIKSPRLPRILIRRVQARSLMLYVSRVNVGSPSFPAGFPPPCPNEFSPRIMRD